MKSLTKKRRRDSAGFSFTEMITTVAIMGIFVSLAIPAFGGAQARAQETAVETAADNGHALVVTASKGSKIGTDGSSNNTDYGKLHEALQSVATPSVGVEFVTPGDNPQVIAAPNNPGSQFCVRAYDKTSLNPQDVFKAYAGDCKVRATPTPTPQPSTPPVVTPPAPAAQLSSFTLQCPATTAVTPPFAGAQGKITFMQGSTVVKEDTYATATNAPSPFTLQAGTTYRIVLDGTFDRFRIHTSTNDRAAAACYRSMDEWSSAAGTRSAESAFLNMTNLTQVPTNIPATVTSLVGAFENATSFNSANISQWDVSRVTSFRSLFREASAFNRPLNSWNTSGATDMGNVFLNAKSFNQPLNNWNTSKVRYMDGMFSGAEAFNGSVANWSHASNTYLQGMFSGAKSFNQPLSSWDVSNVNAFARMFDGATSFNQPIGNWNMRNAWSISAMFKGAASFNQNINDWNVSGIDSMDELFNGATVYNQPLDKWVTTRNTTLRGTFQNAKAFNQPLNSWDVSNVTSTDSTFSGATVFNQPLNSWRTGANRYFENMFRDASAFSQNISAWPINASVPTGRPAGFATNSPLNNNTSFMPAKFR